MLQQPQAYPMGPALMQQTAATTTQTVTTQPGAVPASTMIPGQGGTYYSGPVAVQQKGRSVVTKVLNVIGNLLWITAAVLGIVGASLVIGGVNRSRRAGGILFIIAFSFLLLGSFFKLISDITGMAKANRSIFSCLGFLLILGSIGFIVASIVNIIGAAFYSRNNNNGSRLAGDILFIIGWSIFLFSSFLRYLAAQYSSFEFAKPTSIRGERCRAWSMAFHAGLFLTSAIFLTTGAALMTFDPRGGLRSYERAGAVLWIIGFTSLILGSIFSMFGLTPANPRIDRTKYVQQQMVAPVATTFA